MLEVWTRRHSDAWSPCELPIDAYEYVFGHTHHLDLDFSLARQTVPLGITTAVNRSLSSLILHGAEMSVWQVINVNKQRSVCLDVLRPGPT